MKRAHRLHRPRYTPEGYSTVAIVAAVAYSAGGGSWFRAILSGLEFAAAWWIVGRFLMWWRWGVALRGTGDPAPYVRAISVNPKEYVYVTVVKLLDGTESWIIYRRRRSPFRDKGPTWGKPVA